MNDIERMKLGKLDRAYVEAKVDRGGDYAEMYAGISDTADAKRLRMIELGMTPAEIERDLETQYTAYVQERQRIALSVEAAAAAPAASAPAPESDPAFAGMNDDEVALIWKQSAGDVGKAQQELAALKALKERDRFEARAKESVARVQARQAEQRAELQAHINRNQQLIAEKRAAQLAAARERAIALLTEQELARNGGK